ncbi:Aste57867_830 [Aphanomyces stellatus]|uniref:Aste57867_830 protein n=1 Tax=Aphanomyces stellatus TaxID=120398 RepID=A0A485K6A4_9STRA|nr:hypothetical protein As57867_000829 [Aphanomyces stellatus]VFT78054.1 Aste57867_830 [Aphanomyces stellatus]
MFKKLGREPTAAPPPPDTPTDANNITDTSVPLKDIVHAMNGDDDGDTEDEYSDEDYSDDGDWQDVLDLPIDDILADHLDRDWSDAPLSLLAALPLSDLQKLPIPKSTLLYIAVRLPFAVLVAHVSSLVTGIAIGALFGLTFTVGTPVYVAAVVTGRLPKVEMDSICAKVAIEWDALQLFWQLDWAGCLEHRVRQPQIEAMVTATEKDKKRKCLSQLVLAVVYAKPM